VTPAYALDDAALLAACDELRSAASGPGGQHANRNATGVLLRHPSGSEARSTVHRDRNRNRKEALARLRLRLACDLRAGADRDWLMPHRRGRGLKVSVQGPGFPKVVGVLLDALESAEGRLGAVAADLDLSSTQVVKALAADKEVLAAANACRARHGQGPLRT
jgi:hypothetical protein